MKYELKPCPFCGNEVQMTKAPLWHGSHGYHGCYEFSISCKDCGCTLLFTQNDTVYRSEDEAQNNVIKNWNKRAK